MASTVTDGKFWLVDLSAAEGPYVATVPDFWFIEGNTKCYCPISRDSYEESRSKENQATIQSDINSESDQHTPMGRGHRSNKRAPGRYLHSETVQDERSLNVESEGESVGMYGPTPNLAQQTFVTTPVIPPLLLSNANHQPFPYESTTALHPTPVSFPIHANRVGLGQHFQPELNHRQSTQSSAVLEQILPIPVITPGLADQLNELSDGSKSVLAKLVKEVLKLQENISNLMTKMVVIESKIDMMTKPIESQAAEQREIDPDFMTEPLKEMEDVKLLEQTLLDNDKYYQLGSPEETLYVAQDCFDFNREATRAQYLQELWQNQDFGVAVRDLTNAQRYRGVTKIKHPVDVSFRHPTDVHFIHPKNVPFGRPVDVHDLHPWERTLDVKLGYPTGSELTSMFTMFHSRITLKTDGDDDIV
ncbi:hypothetical protein OUZ56_008796 [Daphnia magna]|uniref:Uncharacterized protein n=1 Tax=Daphnia magna TaxID=35525 RepID=A0ABR0AEF1_9CRUS|nr:hypothetical protein OUZ56_008796 [Daphnia magna]